MSGENEKTIKSSREVKSAVKQNYILRGQPTSTTSAVEPPYLFTSLCPDPKRREPPRQKKKVQHEV